MFRVGRFLKIVSSESACPNAPLYGKKHLWKVLYEVFRSVNKHFHHSQFFFLVGQFLKIFYSETTWPTKAMLYRKHLIWKVLYKISSFHPIGKEKHGRHGKFLLPIDWSLKKIFSSETRRCNKLLLCRYNSMGNLVQNFHISCLIEIW